MDRLLWVEEPLHLKTFKAIAKTDIAKAGETSSTIDNQIYEYGKDVVAEYKCTYQQVEISNLKKPQQTRNPSNGENQM